MTTTSPILSAAQLSAYIKALRKTNSLTQSDVAKMLGVSKMRVATIEKDIGRVSTASMLQLLHLLGGTLALEMQDMKQSRTQKNVSSKTTVATRNTRAAKRGGEW